MSKKKTKEAMNAPVETLDSSLPKPTPSVTTACQYLCQVIDEDMGTKNGRTALYWHLIMVIQQHAGKRP